MTILIKQKACDKITSVVKLVFIGGKLVDFVVLTVLLEHKDTALLSEALADVVQPNEELIQGNHQELVNKVNE